MALALFAAGDTGWSETAVTWNTRPASGLQLAALTVTGTTPKWYEADLTSFLKAEKAAGRNAVTLVLKSTEVTNVICRFNSDEAMDSRPTLAVQT